MAETPQNGDNGHQQHPFAQMIAIGLLASIVGTAIVLVMDWFPEPAAGSSDEIDTLYDVLLIASVPIFVLVMAVVIYCVIRFRARPGDMRDGAPIHGNTRLEVVWVTIPFLIVSGLAIYGWVVLDDIEAKKPDALQVKVTGQQFTWTFDYPQQRVKNSNQLVLPVNRPVHFEIGTEDVIHSFWVPQFRLKSDAVPGLTTRLRLTPDRVGNFDVVCAELCGLGHATMRQTVRVLPQSEFDAWVARQRGGGGGDGGGGGGGGGAAEGKSVFTSAGCGGCHTLGDAGSNSSTGPNLDELASVAGKRERGTSAEDYVRESIVDPRAFTVKGFGRDVMPTTFKDDLSSQEIDALVQYLLDVGGGSNK